MSDYIDDGGDSRVLPINSSRPNAAYTHWRTRYLSLTRAYYHYYLWCSRVFKKSLLVVPFIYTRHIVIYYLYCQFVYVYVPLRVIFL